MRDPEIRIALKTRLREKHAGGADFCVLDELELCQTTARVDLAVVNGRLEGYEIKSDCDSLARLARQARAYDRVFDRMTLVVGKRHLQKAVADIPTWWGVVEASARGEEVRLRTVRQGKANPDRDPVGIASLLSRQQALDLLAARGLDGGLRSRPVDTLRQICADSVSLGVLRAEVRLAVRAREAWRSAPLHGSGDDTSRHGATSSGSRWILPPHKRR